MSNIGRYRILITDYFDGVTNEIDFLIEKELQANSNDSVKMEELNKRREVYLTEIKRVETENLNSLNAGKKKIAVLDELVELDLFKELFSVFCFTVVYKNLTRLITTNLYLSSQQISLYKNLILCANQDGAEDDEIINKDLQFDPNKLFESEHEVFHC
jgi:hypothetical protein